MVLFALQKARKSLLATGNLNSLEASKVLSAFSTSGAIGHIDLEASTVKNLFESGTPLLARTLTNNTIPDAQTAWAIPPTMTPGKLERNTLNNRLQDFNIVLTPATMLDKDIQISTISSHPYRPRWSNMPSVLYAAPAQPTSNPHENLVGSKVVFGNVLSFASNTGFTPQFEARMKGGKYSHAQLINAFRAQPKISDNLKAPTPFNALPQTIAALKEQIVRDHKQQTSLKNNGLPSTLYQDGSVPHNEVVTRLWIWDIHAIDVAQDVSLGLSTAIELQIARKALCTELD